MVLLDKKGQKKQSLMDWFLGRKPKELPKAIAGAVPAEKTLFQIEKTAEVIALPELKDVTTIDVKYPLIPPYAYAHIYWDAKEHELAYELQEPELSEEEKKILKTLGEGIKELINISFLNIKETSKVIEYLEKNLKVLLTEYKISITKETFLKMMYYLYRDFVGLNEIEPLMHDYFIEDLECNGSKTPLYIVHRKYRHIRTNIVFPDNKRLASFVEKLAQKCGKYVSYASPLLDAALPDGSRVNATYTMDISSRGPTFCFTEGYIQLNDGSVKKIDKFFEECKSRFGSKIEDGNEVVDTFNLNCVGVDENTLEQKDCVLKTVIKLKPPERLVELELEDGSKISTTLNHLFHIADDSLKQIEAKDLKRDMFMPIPKKVNVLGCTQKINIHSLIQEFSYSNKVCIKSSQQIKELVNNEICVAKGANGFYREQLSQRYNVHQSYFYEIINRGSSISFEVLNKLCNTQNYNINDISDVSIVVYGGGTKNKEKAIKIPYQVDKELGYLTGAIISDGHLSRASLDVSCYEESFREFVKTCLINKFGKYDSYYNGNRIYLCNLFVPYFFNKVFEIPIGKKHNIVKVPQVIFKSDNDIVASFIKGLFDGDGTCKSGLSYKTNSKELAEGLTYLLARLGIYSYLRSAKTPANKFEYKVNIPSPYYKIYLERIGFENLDKLNHLKELITKQIYHKTFIRHKRIPSKPIRKIIKKLNLSQNKLSKICKITYNRFYYDSYSKSFVKNLLKEVKKEKNLNNIKGELDYIRWMLDSEQEFVKIKNVKVVENVEKKPVYDIELKPCKYFIAGNKPMNMFDTIRKFTKEPWTPVKLMDFKTVSPEVLAYLWLLVEHEANMMVIGGTGSGKTSFLNSIAFFIPPASRVVTIEDSVTGDAEILIKKQNKVQTIPIEKFIKYNKQKTDAQILTLDKNHKLKFVKPSLLLKHKTKKDIYKITTSTGRIIKVTKDHSLFTLGENGLEEVKPTDLSSNKNFVAVPRKIPYKGRECTCINLLNYLHVFKEDFLTGKPIQKIFKEYKYRHFEVSKNKYKWWKSHNLIKIKDLLKINFKFEKKDLQNLKIKSRAQTTLPIFFKITKEFLELIGLWLGDGSYDRYNKNRIIISNSDKECIALTKKIAKKLNFNISRMNDGVSLTINSTIFYKFMKNVIGLKGRSATKRVPSFIQNLSNEQLKHVIRGYFSADGCVKKYEVSCASQSFGLLQDLQTIFLRRGIISRITDLNRKDKCINLSISSHKNVTKFKQIGFLQSRKNRKLNCICNKKAHHTVTDIIPLNINQLKEVDKYHKICWPYLQGMQNIGREYLQRIAPEGSLFNDLSHSDILWDKVKKIEKLKPKERYVYDISVPGTEKFVGSNIILHNTRELNLLHENWLPSVARAGVGMATITGEKHGEVSLFTLLRESFRQRPDYVVVGEIRGKEAFVLFQGAASVKGDEKVLVLNDKHPKRIAIKDLKENVRYKAITIDPADGKAKILPVKFKVKHSPRNVLYKITTEKGREVVVTSDHSVFNYKNKIVPFRVEELKEGDNIVVPAKIPCGYADMDYINLIEELDDIRIYAPELIRDAVKKLNYNKCCEICEVKAVSDYYADFTKHETSALKAKKFIKLMEYAGINYNFDDLKVRLKYSKKMNPKLELNKEFLKLLGYYLSEGSMNETGRNSKLLFYNKDKNVLDDIRKCIKNVIGREPRERVTDRGYGTCTELCFSSKIICEFIKKNFGKKDSKKIADFIFGLSKEKIGWFLSGLWAGDGEMTKRRFGYYTTSKILANDVAQLLLVYGIVCKIKKRRRKGRNKEDYELLFYSRKEKERFLEYVNPVNKKVDLSQLRKIRSKEFINDIYVDKIKSISEIRLDKKEPVYDISVPGTQNFIGGFGGLMLHNSGHPCMSTMHAESVDTMIKRLETPPINLSPALVETLNIVCVMIQTKVNGKPVRRLKEVVEVISVPSKGKAVLNIPFVRDPARDMFWYKSDSRMLDKISKEQGIPKETLYAEWQRRTNLLMALYHNKIFGFKEVYETIKKYNKNPKEVLRKFRIK